MKEAKHWDLDYDVVVAGYGYAGGILAIFASNAVTRIVIPEKMARFGGNSILSGGSVTVADDAELALQYLRRTCLDATADDVLQVFARGMVELRGMLELLGGEIGFRAVENRKDGTYPFPGNDSGSSHKPKRILQRLALGQGCQSRGNAFLGCRGACKAPPD